ncbi:hypothetical protein GCM10029992_23330 [Glycomyces albus]
MADDENARARSGHAEDPAGRGDPCPAVYDLRARRYLAAREGDRRAQRELFEDLNELLWRVARRAGLDRESAADVVQTAWLRLWLPENELENPRALTKWLLVTVRREAWRTAGGARRELATDPIEFPGSQTERGTRRATSSGSSSARPSGGRSSPSRSGAGGSSCTWRRWTGPTTAASPRRWA